MNDVEVLKELLTWALGPGAGIAVYAVVGWLAREWADEGKEISPKTKRRLSYLVSLLLPSGLYGLLLLLPDMGAYQWWTHALYVLAAFGVSQIAHGERELPGGSD